METQLPEIKTVYGASTDRFPRTDVSEQEQAMAGENDIKAPDGFLLGGLRRVRKDGTILFQRGWWKAPDDWIGEDVWVHCMDGGAGDLEAAPPGLHIYDARPMKKVIRLPRTDRDDAKPGYRDPIHKAWVGRMKK